jgi:hypothetical protein
MFYLLVQVASLAQVPASRPHLMRAGPALAQEVNEPAPVEARNYGAVYAGEAFCAARIDAGLSILAAPCVDPEKVRAVLDREVGAQVLAVPRCSGYPIESARRARV